MENLTKIFRCRIFVSLIPFSLRNYTAETRREKKSLIYCVRDPITKATLRQRAECTLSSLKRLPHPIDYYKPIIFLMSRNMYGLFQNRFNPTNIFSKITVTQRVFSQLYFQRLIMTLVSNESLSFMQPFYPLPPHSVHSAHYHLMAFQ